MRIGLRAFSPLPTFSAVLSSLLLWQGAAANEPSLARRPFVDSRDPPYYRELDAAEKAQAELGHAIFNTQWVPAGTANAERRDGVGPLYNASACDACHNEGAHGRGPTGDGDVTGGALVMELDTVPRTAGSDQRGDPHYGRTLNTTALEGIDPEAVTKVYYHAIVGRYPDGTPWTLRSPQYRLSALKYGPLSKRTILEPRLAPALFGLGLLESVPDAPIGRFGWQGTSRSIREQTGKAFARDMGLTSSAVPADDCTAVERQCLAAANGGTPEVSDEFLTAVIEFQRNLAVPERLSAPAGAASGTPAADSNAPEAVPQSSNGAPEVNLLFDSTGCSACHSPRLTAMLTDDSGAKTPSVIDPFTDLRLHDLGSALSDHDVAGHAIRSLWRTAPLWGMGYRIRAESVPTFLHDGRARSVEEAILWHGGEAQGAKRNFERLSAADRQQLLRWIATL